MFKYKYLIIILVIIFSIFIIKFLCIFPWNVEDLISSEPPQKADLIVILGGDINNRFEKAFKLAKKGYCDKIFCPTVRFDENQKIIDLFINNNPEIESYFESGSTSTLSDAKITNTYISDKNIKTILLVTSDYHSFRAEWVFTKILNETEIVSQPVITSYSKQISENNARKHWAFHSERQKFAFYYFFYRFL